MFEREFCSFHANKNAITHQLQICSILNTVDIDCIPFGRGGVFPYRATVNLVVQNNTQKRTTTWISPLYR